MIQERIRAGLEKLPLFQKGIEYDPKNHGELKRLRYELGDKIKLCIQQKDVIAKQALAIDALQDALRKAQEETRAAEAALEEELRARKAMRSTLNRMMEAAKDRNREEKERKEKAARLRELGVPEDMVRAHCEGERIAASASPPRNDSGKERENARMAAFCEQWEKRLAAAEDEDVTVYDSMDRKERSGNAEKGIS